MKNTEQTKATMKSTKEQKVKGAQIARARVLTTAMREFSRLAHSLLDNGIEGLSPKALETIQVEAITLMRPVTRALCNASFELGYRAGVQAASEAKARK